MTFFNGNTPWNKGKQTGLKPFNGFKKGCVSHNKGKHLSQITRDKMSESRRGKHPSQETKDKISKSRLGSKNPMFGRPNPAQAERCRQRTGEKHPNWKNGLSKEPYPFEWTETLKESIRQRDNYICQKCHIPQRELLRRLSIHHIDYIKDNLDPKNLISLCISCNNKVNYNREYWEQDFKKLIKRDDINGLVKQIRK